MHIDGYVIPVPETKKAAFVEMAEWFDQAMINSARSKPSKAGRPRCPRERTDLRKAVAAEPGDKIVFSWIVWPDKPTAEAAHEAIHEDERFKAMTDIPFDERRMIFGGFEPVVNLRRDG